jgi:DNA-directed RNA polymerase sigma subunit (sigma70/sigma32)
MKKYKLVKISNSLFGKTYNDERKDYIIKQLNNTIDQYRYFPERLKEEMIKLEKEINDYNFVGMNKECYAYRVTIEKLKLIKQIYYRY